MAVVVYPLDAVAGAPSYTGRMLRDTIGVLFAGATTARPLGIRSGVRPGTPDSTISITGTTYTLAEFAGAVDAEAAAEAGPYLFAINASSTGSTAAADASNPRKDLLSLRIDDPAESDGTSVPLGAIVYTTGVAASTPARPATPARSIPLVEFQVPKSGTGSPTATWIAPVLAAAGGAILATDLTILQSMTSGLVAGDKGVVYADSTTANNGTYRWDGTAWRPVFRDTFVVPSSVSVGSGSSVTNSDGSVTVTGASSVTFNGVFPSGVIHCASEVAIDTATVSTSLNVRMCVGGTPQTGATDYRYEVGIFKGTTTTAPANSTGNSSAQLSDTGLSFYGRVDFYNANKALATYMTADLVAGVSGASPTRTDASGFWGVATAADGIQFIPAAGGTITGTFAFRSL